MLNKQVFESDISDSLYRGSRRSVGGVEASSLIRPDGTNDGPSVLSVSGIRRSWVAGEFQPLTHIGNESLPNEWANADLNRGPPGYQPSAQPD